jgi:hypothetical protein
MYRGQAIASLEAGGVLTLNRVDTLYNQTLFNQIAGGTQVTSASIVMVKVA